MLNFLGNSSDIIFWDTAHFQQDTWDDDAHKLYQDILWDAFQDFWYTPDVYNSSKAYDVTLNQIWNRVIKPSQGGDKGGGRILLIYEVIEYRISCNLYDIVIHIYKYISLIPNTIFSTE